MTTSPFILLEYFLHGSVGFQTFNDDITVYYSRIFPSWIRNVDIDDVPGEIVEVVHDDGNEEIQDEEGAHDEETE
jgi:hypothetical protein